MSRKVKTKYDYKEVEKAFRVFEGLPHLRKNEQDTKVKTNTNKKSFSNSNVGESGYSGKIHFDVLHTALTQYGSNPLSGEEASELLNQLEPDEDKMLSYSDYIDLMTN